MKNIKNIKFRLWAYLVFVVFALVLVGISGCLQTEKATEEKSKEKAMQFIENSSTYKFDGFELKYREARALKCPSCWQFTFEFKSKQAGYGDRTGQILAQVITPHTAVITVAEGNVILAVLDGKWDMIEQKFIVRDEEQLIGGDKDVHGCLIAAGYSWCESKQKCLRIWEENCTAAVSGSVITSEECTSKEGRVIEVSGGSKCAFNEIDAGKVEGFTTPHICCIKNETCVGLPNTAAKNCVDLGYRYEIRKGKDGGEYGVCIFPDGNECEEWQLLRGNCSYILPPKGDFCGWSTEGNCSYNSDCIISGCSGQGCQSKKEEVISTTCEWRNCYKASAYNMTCKCVENKCKWAK